MGNPFSDLLSGGISGILGGVKDIISSFVVDPEKKLEATQKLAELETGFREKQMEAQSAFDAQQASVIIAEAKSDSWMARNWRPITMLTFVSIIVWNYVVVGTVGALQPSIHVIVIPTDMWELLKLGIGGYIGARTVEKVADTIATTTTKNKALDTTEEK